jgi:hypothetical protein
MQAIKRSVRCSNPNSARLPSRSGNTRSWRDACAALGQRRLRATARRVRGVPGRGWPVRPRLWATRQSDDLDHCAGAASDLQEGRVVAGMLGLRCQDAVARCEGQACRRAVSHNALARMKSMSAHLASIASPINAKSNRYRRCIHDAVSNPNPRWSARRDHATCKSHTIGLQSNSLGRMPSAAKPASIA